MTAPATLGARTLPAFPGIHPEQMTVAEYGRPLASYYGDRLAAAEIALSFTQASTLKLTFLDPRRELIGSPLLNQAVTIDTGANPPVRFRLVQVTKAGDTISATYEDALINRLRGITGQTAAAGGVLTRADFAGQLLRAAGIPAVVAPASFTSPALAPLTRGTSNTPNEDTWACLIRLAGDVAYRCFSDGTAVWFGPDAWLLSRAPVAQIAEHTDAVDVIDFDYDVGKPVAKATVATYARGWTAHVGGAVQILNLAAATGRWLCSDISRNLSREATKASLVVATPTLPEPDPNATQTVTFQAKK